MKRSSLALWGLLTNTFVFPLWRIDVSITIAALGAIGYACSSGAAPACAIATAGAIIITALSGMNSGQTSGTTGGDTRRSLVPIAHYLPNGTVHDYLNTAALEVGVEHTVQTGEHTLYASKHADGYNILRASLNNNNNNNNNNSGAPGQLAKRTDPNAIEDISAQFGDRN